ncbi:DUF2776 domain-containing protein [Odoribacter lunatus]|uniref:DUF2776 domain-containing protein n=1 Tax=Odoribacter lunatus TaxID=2941335 RepID=UPI00203AE268|nr:DUF2776 domain-containing protein [Odoribacter lunatus]
MNYGISVLFRAIPVMMALICFFLGGFIFTYGNDAAREVAGPVVFFLGAICLALYATAAIIIRQLIHKFHTLQKYLIPCFGYAVALTTFILGLWIMRQGTSNYLLSGHVVCGIALIAACVSTAATSSTKFYLIPVNSASTGKDINKEGFSKGTERLLITLTVLFSLTAWIWCIVLLSRSSWGTVYFVAGTVMGGLACICSSLIALVASISRQIRNDYGGRDRCNWPKVVFFFGTLAFVWGLLVVLTKVGEVAHTTGFIMLGLGLVCFSISSKVLLLAKVWKQQFALANRIPLIPVMTALFCLFTAAYLFEAGTINNAYFVPARVLAGLGAICFCLFSIVSILESGTSKK